MKLADYLEANGLSAAEFGRRIGADRSTVTRWLKPPGDDGSVFRPSWEQIAKIREETGGLVTANDFEAAEPEAA